ncbi:Cupredoxin [Macrophomina phaseolina MS6]|uniref:Cupredoxin n=1 Tax=Macrophomina phaseolina (strain MS6) TaxID=1126212 RepID=K2SE61_MACPH|nr:Cupredoxin [Macrophomina phaseolina MS6]
MDSKYEIIPSAPDITPDTPKKRNLLKALSSFSAVLLCVGGVAKYYLHRPVFEFDRAPNSAGHAQLKGLPERVPATVNYNLTISQAWRNPDGGHWRPLFVGNSESPFPTINAHEGDMVNIHIHNDLGLPISAHWVGVHHKMGGTWNDGSSGVTSYPILPRANRTSTFNTSGDWGLKWFLEHTSTPSVDGMYGAIWIRPSAERERPYHLISDDPLDIQDMMEAEENPAHVTAYNYQHREMPGLLAQLQTEGYDPYCFQSILINGRNFFFLARRECGSSHLTGKGRVHCKPDDLKDIDGKPVDSYGCVEQPSGAVAYDECKPSDGDYEVFAKQDGYAKASGLIYRRLSRR